MTYAGGAPVRVAAGASAAAGCALALSAGYLAVLSLAAQRWRAPLPAPDAPRTRLVVLVPAHDESELVVRCVTGLLDQDYPPDLRRVVVVADNCGDDTAARALAAGAEVLERTAPEQPGKGPALRWAMDTVLASGRPVDAFVVVDADSVTGPGLLRGLVAPLRDGAQVVQGEYLALEEAGSGELRAAAFLLFHRTRFRGRQVLGLPVPLVGNGMLFTRQAVLEHPWRAASSVEDLEHTLDLRTAGVRPAFAPLAAVRAPVSTDPTGASTQRLRWEGGRAHVVRTRLPALARQVVRGRPDLWDCAVDLATPPLGVLAVGLGAGTLLAGVLRATRGASTRVLLPWLAGDLGLAVHVLAGLHAAGAPRSTYVAMLRAPGHVLRETVTRLGLLRGTGADTWTRTARPGELARGHREAA